MPYDPSVISSDDDIIALKEFDANTVSEGLRLGRELQTYFVEKDPNSERSIQRKIQEALSQYEEVFKDLRQSKQLWFTNFLTSSKNNQPINFEDGNASCSVDNEIPVEEILDSDSDSDAMMHSSKKRHFGFESSEEEWRIRH